MCRYGESQHAPSLAVLLCVQVHRALSQPSSTLTGSGRGGITASTALLSEEASRVLPGATKSPDGIGDSDDAGDVAAAAVPAL